MRDRERDGGGARCMRHVARGPVGSALRQDIHMSRTMQSPGVAHIVVDLDDVEVVVSPRRGSMLARVSGMVRRAFGLRRRLAGAMSVALLIVLAACSDSTDPMTPAPVASVGVTPTTVVLDPPGARQLTAIVRDAAGNVLEGRTVEWSTDAPGIATVSATGMVQAIAHGYAVITATVDGKSASAAVTDTEPDPT